MTTTGIYEIVNVVNGHRYIGQSANIERRWRHHLRDLGRGQSSNVRLQNAWNKYGDAAFRFNVLGECIPAKVALTFFENAALSSMLPEYNICQSAESVLGIKRTPEQNAARATLMKGKKQPPRTPETCAQISNRMMGNKYGVGSKGRLGQKHSAEIRAKISQAKKGKKHTPGRIAAHAQRMMGNQFTRGHILSPLHRAKISTGMSGKRNALGHKPTAEERLNKSLALKGKPWSAKRRAAQVKKTA